ncbi:Y' element ATP-dependent helicase YJL225C-like [Gigantopelta aegis]|uniref:Y' element ATP-dependent helicase YJL225C-like n=1 Tax=Gigantopelta aegis TaxID=1735272 RepID=UPI001B888DC8|nr:Y' element ATP-dependent helicase YJL225C-like [Gigantopelta aegis]
MIDVETAINASVFGTPMVNTSSTEDLHLNSNTSSTEDLYLNSNTSSTEDLHLNSNTSSTEDLYLNSNTSSTEDLHLNSNTSSTEDLYLNSNTSTEDLHLNSNTSSTEDLHLNSNTLSTEDLHLNSNMSSTEDLHLNSNTSSTEDLHLNSNTSSTEDLHLNSNTSSIDKSRFLCETGQAQDRARSGRPRVTAPAEDHYIRTIHLRNRFVTAMSTAATALGHPISRRTVLRQLRRAGIRAFCPFCGMALTPETVNADYNGHELYVDGSGVIRKGSVHG